MPPTYVGILHPPNCNTVIVYQCETEAVAREYVTQHRSGRAYWFSGELRPAWATSCHRLEWYLSPDQVSQIQREAQDFHFHGSTRHLDDEEVHARLSRESTYVGRFHGARFYEVADHDLRQRLGHQYECQIWSPVVLPEYRAIQFLQDAQDARNFRGRFFVVAHPDTIAFMRCYAFAPPQKDPPILTEQHYPLRLRLELDRLSEERSIAIRQIDAAISVATSFKDRYETKIKKRPRAVKTTRRRWRLRARSALTFEAVLERAREGLAMGWPIDPKRYYLRQVTDAYRRLCTVLAKTTPEKAR